METKPIPPNTLGEGLNLDLSLLLWQNAHQADWDFKAPNDREEAGKPRVRWTRLICTEGSEDQIAHYKRQSCFNRSMKMGNVTCIVLEDDDVDAKMVKMVDKVLEYYQSLQKEKV